MSSTENAGMMGSAAMESSMKSISVMTKGLQQVASETTEFTKSSFDQSTRMMEQLFQSRSLDKVIELQNDYAKSAYQAWMSQATKLGDIYTEMAKEACKPLESMMSNGMASFRKTS